MKPASHYTNHFFLPFMNCTLLKRHYRHMTRTRKYVRFTITKQSLRRYLWTFAQIFPFYLKTFYDGKIAESSHEYISKWLLYHWYLFVLPRYKGLSKANAGDRISTFSWTIFIAYFVSFWEKLLNLFIELPHRLKIGVLLWSMVQNEFVHEPSWTWFCDAYCNIIEAVGKTERGGINVWLGFFVSFMLEAFLIAIP